MRAPPPPASELRRTAGFVCSGAPPEPADRPGTAAPARRSAGAPACKRESQDKVSKQMMPRLGLFCPILRDSGSISLTWLRKANSLPSTSILTMSTCASPRSLMMDGSVRTFTSRLPPGCMTPASRHSRRNGCFIATLLLLVRLVSLLLSAHACATKGCMMDTWSQLSVVKGDIYRQTSQAKSRGAPSAFQH